jgi:serine/threonine protein phosphatase PrpC
MSDVAGVTHIGKVRKENQDGFLAERFNGKATKDFLCLAVADGMGGHQKGRLASEQAIEVVRHSLSDTTDAPTSKLCVAIEQAAHQTVGKIAIEGETVGTTLTLLLIQDYRGYIAHVGDSRVYRLRDGQLVQLTEDQVWDEKSEYGLQLRQAIGVGEKVVPDALDIDLQDGDWLLVCSDGLHKFVAHDSLEKTLNKASKVDRACSQLLDLALEAGGRDNIAIALGRIGNTSGTKSPSQKQNLILVVSVTIVLLFVALIALLVFRRGV